MQDLLQYDNESNENKVEKNVKQETRKNKLKEKKNKE